MGVEAVVVALLPCNVGRLAFTSFMTGGALACRVNFTGGTLEPLVGAIASFRSSMFELEFALSALRRAGFLRGFLLGVVVLEGGGLEAAASTGVVISDYLLV